MATGTHTDTCGHRGSDRTAFISAAASSICLRSEQLGDAGFTFSSKTGPRRPLELELPRVHTDPPNEVDLGKRLSSVPHAHGVAGRTLLLLGKGFVDRCKA